MTRWGPGARPVSFQTICNWMHPPGLQDRNIHALSIHVRRAFYEEHVCWNRAQWQTVLFSDESLFYLLNVDGRQRVLPQHRERHSHCTIMQTVNGREDQL
ncbi:hypothetical protein MAR_026540 [Mya arenaria]|uniref:Transposase n=1 Tax=Mya arenaria TaxID=6604 RepID=A0ABY7ER88_MYAAR|nr:hypothetical protein MAR_026540 [Mya arenaria]